MSTDSIDYLKRQIIEFRDERDWKQFHTPKNCAANVVVESAELLDHYRWKESADDRQAATEEAADVMWALLLYCEAEGIDIGEAVVSKLAKNATKYPVERVKGKAEKYHNYNQAP